MSDQSPESSSELDPTQSSNAKKLSAVLAVRHDDEREAITMLLKRLDIEVFHARTGRQLILTIEDYNCNFVITDIKLPDTHAWSMLGSLKEIVKLSQLPILVISDEMPSVLPPDNVTIIVRPVAVARLRQVIEAILLNLQP